MHRIRLLRRGARRDLGHPARRTEHGASDADLAGGSSFGGVSLARRHQAPDPPAGDGGGLLSVRNEGVRPRRAVPDAGFRAFRPRHRDEYLDVRSLPLSREALGPRQGAPGRDLAKVASFERYRDVDKDGIPYRTLPGTDHPLAGYF